MSSLLPMKETSREVVVEVARTLQPWFPEITAAWRQQMFTEFDFDGRAMAALERLTIGTGFSIFSQTDFATFYEQPAAFRRAPGQTGGQCADGGAIAGRFISS